MEVLDGDEVRRGLSADLGFSKEDRNANVRRVGFVAQLLASHGVKVLVPVIAPYVGTRAEVRARHVEAGTPYLEVHVAAPVEVCMTRDVKGLYAKQAAGELTGLTGVDDPYEPRSNQSSASAPTRSRYASRPTRCAHSSWPRASRRSGPRPGPRRVGWVVGGGQFSSIQ